MMTNAWREVSEEPMTVVTEGMSPEGECFKLKMPTLDVLSIGPTIKHPHTVAEVCRLDTIGRQLALLRKVLAAIPGDEWTDPATMEGADANQRCAAALRVDGFSDRFAAKLADVELYASFVTWAKMRGYQPVDLRLRGGVILAAAYGADNLPTSEEVKLSIDELEVGVTVSFSVLIEGTTAGFDAGRVDAALQKAAIGIEGASSLANGFSEEGLTIESAAVEGSDRVRFKIRIDPNQERFFLRARAD